LFPASRHAYCISPHQNSVSQRAWFPPQATFYTPQRAFYVPQATFWIPQCALNVPHGALYVPQHVFRTPQGGWPVPHRGYLFFLPVFVVLVLDECLGRGSYNPLMHGAIYLSIFLNKTFVRI
jgi:hypothetical protein